MTAPVSVPRALLESLVEDDECRLDHHGGCQGHGYLELEPGEKCPQAELKEILANTCPHCGGPLERNVAFLNFGSSKGCERFELPPRCPSKECRAARDEAVIADPWRGRFRGPTRARGRSS